jgi:hypothetical protein
MLDGHDMEAIEAFDEIQIDLDTIDSRLTRDLKDALRRLDFATAQRLCAELRYRMTA